MKLNEIRTKAYWLEELFEESHNFRHAVLYKGFTMHCPIVDWQSVKHDRSYVTCRRGRVYESSHSHEGDIIELDFLTSFVYVPSSVPGGHEKHSKHSYFCLFLMRVFKDMTLWKYDSIDRLLVLFSNSRTASRASNVKETIEFPKVYYNAKTGKPTHEIE